MNTFNALLLGYTGAILSALGMLALGILGNFGFYLKIVEHMQDWHAFFSLSVAGIVGGMIEAAIFSFVALYIFAFVYNLLVVKFKK